MGGGKGQHLHTLTKKLGQCEAGSKQRSAHYLLQAGFLLGLFFNHEDGGDMFFFF
jgi:hypothetical protein